MPRDDEFPKLDFGLIKNQLDTFITATGNRIERQWPKHIPQHPGSHAVVLGLYRTAENNYWTLRFVLADKPANPSRKLEFALATSPLIRSLVEWLAAVVYLFEDLPARTVQFHKAGWREGALETDHFRDIYGSDPAWALTISSRTDELKRLYTQHEITKVEALDPTKKIAPWPRIGTIVKRLREPRKSQISYVNDWFYKLLSDDSHPTWLGIGRQFRLLMRNPADEEGQRHELELARTKQVDMSLGLMLAIATEIDRELGFGDQDKAKYVWSFLTEWDPDIRDLYDRFYAATMGPARIGKLDGPPTDASGSSLE